MRSIRLIVPLQSRHPGYRGLPVPPWGKTLASYQRSARHITSPPPSKENSDPYTPWLMDSRTLRYQATSRGLVPHPSNDNWEQWIVELARFAVPERMFGVAKTFDQFIARSSVEVTDLPTINANWGIPFLGFGTTDFGAIRWHFRLSEYYGAEHPWINAINTTSLPGQPHPDMAFTDDIWFPAHSPNANNIHLPVPGKHVLRVFLQLPAQTVRPYAGARLSGWTSTYLSPENRHAVRTYW